MHPKLKAMIDGYGPNFPSLEEIFNYQLDPSDDLQLRSPIPALGRYRKNVDFLSRVTSGTRIGLLRFKVIIEYFIALAKLMEGYEGQFSFQKIITGFIRSLIVIDINPVFKKFNKSFNIRNALKV